jgi:hypothetical protein
MADPVIRSYVEGLRKQSLPNGVMSSQGLKVAGEDPLPKGAELRPNVVIAGGGVTLDGWDLGGRGIVVAGRVRLNNILSQGIVGPKSGGPAFPIDIRVGGDLEWAEKIDMAGTYGKGESPSAVLNARNEGSGTSFTAGILRMLRRSRFQGFGADHLKLHGVRGGTTIIEENYFGPQWASGGKPHADCFTTVAALGNLVIRRNLVDWNDRGRPIGVNNVFRIVRNSRTSFPVQHVLIQENVCYHGPFKSLPIQVTSGGQPNFDGPIEFIGNWLGANASGRYFHPSTNGMVARWAANSDLATGRAIVAPAGARTT